MIYRARVVHEEEGKRKKEDNLYMGQTGQEIRKRIKEAESDIRIREKKNSTRLTGYVWGLKEEGKKYRIEWEILERAREYAKGGKSCNLCNREKVQILKQEKKRLLNGRDELMTKCFHKRKHKVENYKGVETEGDVLRDRERQEEEERREEAEEEVVARGQEEKKDKNEEGNEGIEERRKKVKMRNPKEEAEIIEISDFRRKIIGRKEQGRRKENN